MRRSNDFSLFVISDVPYLLPFGQGIADLKRGVQINDTGAYLWDLLDKERTEEEMLSLYAAHYEIPDSQLPQLKSDLLQFLHMLDNFGMLKRSDDPICPDAIPDSNGHDITGIPVSAGGTVQTDATSSAGQNFAEGSNIAVRNNTVRRYLSIGGLTLLLNGPAKAFSRDFDAFEIFPDPGSDTPPTASQSHTSHIGQDASAKESALHIDQTVSVISHTPAQRPEGNTLIKNRELTVMENDLQYIFLFHSAPEIYEAHLTKDGADARYYCCSPCTENLQQDLFHAIRLSFLYLAQLHDMVVLHSASLLYRGKAWLFSGHSGAGKSTHTQLWKELYKVPLINGDLNLLSTENGYPMVHGLPWCGTSGIADTCSYPLGGILLIKKSLQNHAAVLDVSHAQLLVTQRLISPSWTRTLMQKNLSLIADLAPHILICRLHCTKTPEAAETGKRAIDDYLQRSEK